MQSVAQNIPVFSARWFFPHRYHLAIGEPYNLEPAPENVDVDWLHAKAEEMRQKVDFLSKCWYRSKNLQGTVTWQE